MGKKPVVLIDGANIGHIEKSQDGKPKMSNIVGVCQALREKGFRPLVIVDASFRHEVDDPDQLEALLDNQEVYQAPAGTEADFFLLKTSEENGAMVVSNDNFSEFHDQYPWIEERRVPAMIINGEVILYEDKLVDREE
jgi:hypothetical protein